MTRPSLGLVNSVTRYGLAGGPLLRWLARRVLRVVVFWFELRLALHALGLPWPRYRHLVNARVRAGGRALSGAGGGNPQSLPPKPRQGPQSARGDGG